MRSVLALVTLKRNDPMRYVYPLYCLFLCLAILGVVLQVPGLWGTGIAGFSLVGLFACYMTICLPTVQNTQEAGGVEMF